MHLVGDPSEAGGGMNVLDFSSFDICMNDVDTVVVLQQFISHLFCVYSSHLWNTVTEFIRDAFYSLVLLVPMPSI